MAMRTAVLVAAALVACLQVASAANDTCFVQVRCPSPCALPLCAAFLERGVCAAVRRRRLLVM